MLERPLIKGVVHISCLQCGNVMCSPGKGAVIQGLEQGLNITNFRICCGNKVRSFFHGFEEFSIKQSVACGIGTQTINDNVCILNF